MRRTVTEYVYQFGSSASPFLSDRRKLKWGGTSQYIRKLIADDMARHNNPTILEQDVESLQSKIDELTLLAASIKKNIVSK